MDIKIKIENREIPLVFGMDEYGCFEEEFGIGSLAKFNDIVFSGKERIHNIIKLIRIMGNKGLSRSGEEADLTDEWLGEHLKPRKLGEYQTVVTAAVSIGMDMETDRAKDPEAERDIVLEEIEKKEDAINSPTGK